MIASTSIARGIARACALAVLVTAAFAGTLEASNGDIQLHKPTTITEPGRYVVTQDIFAMGDVLVITVLGVTVDLNGHTIQSLTGTGVLIDLTGAVGPLYDIRILNGRISGGAHGVRGIMTPDTLPILIDEVGIVGPMIDCINFQNTIPVVRVSSSTLAGCGRDGIRMLSAGGTGLLEVTNSTIFEVQGNGILASGIEGATVRGTTIRRFGLDGNDAAGVLVSIPGKVGFSILDSVLCDGSVRGDGLALEIGGSTSPVNVTGCTIGRNGASASPVNVTGCTIGRNGASGIRVRGGSARIGGNTIAGNAGAGILLDAAGFATQSKISDNSIVGNTLQGIDVVEGVAHVGNNAIGSNGGDGMRVGGLRVFIDGNVVQGNGGWGLRLLNAGEHAYRGNFLLGNTNGGVDDAFGNTNAGGNIP